VTRTPLSRSNGQGHQAALLIAAFTHQAAAAVSVGTYSPWEPLPCCGQLGGASAPTEGGEGRGHIVAAPAQLVDTRCASGCVAECRIWNWEVAGSNLGRGYLALRSTQPSIPPASLNEYQLRLGKQRQVWLIPLADETQDVQVKLCYSFTMRAIPECLRDVSCGGVIQIDNAFYLYVNTDV